jgi:hypothetical protein
MIPTCHSTRSQVVASPPPPHPNWGYGVAQTDLRRLQPLLEAIQGLLQRRLMSVEILWTLLSHGVQPLHRREVNARMNTGSSCLDCLFSAEMGNTMTPLVSL